MISDEDAKEYCEYLDISTIFDEIILGVVKKHGFGLPESIYRDILYIECKKKFNEKIEVTKEEDILIFHNNTYISRVKMDLRIGGVIIELKSMNSTPTSRNIIQAQMYSKHYKKIKNTIAFVYNISYKEIQKIETEVYLASKEFCCDDKMEDYKNNLKINEIYNP